MMSSSIYLSGLHSPWEMNKKSHCDYAWPNDNDNGNDDGNDDDDDDDVDDLLVVFKQR